MLKVLGEISDKNCVLGKFNIYCTRALHYNRFTNSQNNNVIIFLSTQKTVQLHRKFIATSSRLFAQVCGLKRLQVLYTLFPFLRLVFISSPIVDTFRPLWSSTCRTYKGVPTNGKNTIFWNLWISPYIRLTSAPPTLFVLFAYVQITCLLLVIYKLVFFVKYNCSFCTQYWNTDCIANTSVEIIFLIINKIKIRYTSYYIFYRALLGLL